MSDEPPAKSPSIFQAMGKQLTIEQSEDAHKTAAKRMKDQVQQKTRKCYDELKGSVQQMETEFEKMDLLENDLMTEKMQFLKDKTSGYEARRLKVAILPNSVERLKYEDADKGKLSEADMLKLFNWKTFDRIGGISVQPCSKVEMFGDTTKSKPTKMKRGVAKVKQFLGLNKDKVLKEAASFDDLNVSKELLPSQEKFSKEAVAKKPNQDTRARDKDENKTGIVKPSGKLSKEPSQPKKQPESNKRSPAHTPQTSDRPGASEKKPITPKPWYKFW